MQISAKDIHTFHRPKKCELRVYYRHKGVAEAAPGPFEEVLVRLGHAHEKRQLEQLESVRDLSHVPWPRKAELTRSAIQDGVPAIYQGMLRAQRNIGGAPCELVGLPDFLIKDLDGYVIRDAKLSRRINEKDHPEILRQLELYGILYETTFGQSPAGLQVFAGSGETVEIQAEDKSKLMQCLETIRRIKTANRAPRCPVGWSKCGQCGYRENCWPTAEKKKDVALIPDLDESLVTALHAEGVLSISQLLAKYDADTLADKKRPWGSRMQRVGTKAQKIMNLARALHSGEMTVLASPAIPTSRNYVMFDIEGMPPLLDELEKIYLWGVQVFGETPGEYKCATAAFGTVGDAQGWFDFLQNAQDIFNTYGNIPFVHWHSYEKTHVTTYMDRYGDPNGVASRLLENLLDLLPITREAVALPVFSYSLKEVECHVGFSRTQNEYGGDWAMAQYIEACETDDAERRAGAMQQILDYNREDLEATWAVLTWLKSLSDRQC